MSAADRNGFPVIAGFAVVACAVSWLLCLKQGITAPLWIDEGATGAFASQPSLASLTELVGGDPNAPLYSYLMWFWARAFGLSDVSLRMPSLLFCMATPAIAWAGLHRTRPLLACVWAALLALWFPGIVQAGYARCYSLLTLLSVATAIAAIGAYEAPSRRRVIVWAVGACLMTLTHYFAGPLALAQGLVLLPRYRHRWRDAWLVTAAFLPAFAWIGWHVPQLVAFAQPGVGWYDRLTLADLPTVLSVFFGPPLCEAALPAALTVSLMLPRRVAGAERSRRPADRAVIATGLASLAAAVFCLVVAALRPSFTFRYLTPFAPGLLLLAAAGVLAASRQRWQPLAVLIGGSLVGVSLAVVSEDVALGKVFSLEPASAWLAASHPARLTFFWDNPTTRATRPGELDAIGGFFLRRAGSTVAVAPVYTIPGVDMTGPVVAAAGPDGALLWVYDTAIHDTTAILHPPHIAATSGAECRDFGIFNVGIVACRPRR